MSIPGHAAPLLALALILWPLLAPATGDDVSGRAAFTLSVTMATGDMPQAEDMPPLEEMPVMALSGELAFTAGKLRVDVHEELTQEHVIVLVDYGAGLLYMLYPDTLNGTRHSLADFDELAGFTAMRDVFAGGEPELPEDWQASSAPAQLDDKPCTKYSAASEDMQAEWWIGEGDVPLKAVVRSAPLTVTVDIISFERDGDLDAALFELPKGYTITEGEGTPSALPAL